MYGVYIIWYGGPNAATVYVGQGEIKERLNQHRSNQQIQSYDHLGLYVTWASVAQSSRDGVEAYLAGRLSPKVGEAHPNATSIEVNLPCIITNFVWTLQKSILMFYMSCRRNLKLERPDGWLMLGVHW